MERPEVSEKAKRATERDYGNDRTERVSIRVTKIEKAHYEEMAAAQKLSLSDLGRGVLNAAYKSERWRG